MTASQPFAYSVTEIHSQAFYASVELLQLVLSDLRMVNEDVFAGVAAIKETTCVLHDKPFNSSGYSLMLVTVYVDKTVQDILECSNSRRILHPVTLMVSTGSLVAYISPRCPYWSFVVWPAPAHMASTAVQAACVKQLIFIAICRTFSFPRSCPAVVVAGSVVGRQCGVSRLVQVMMNAGFRK